MIARTASPPITMASEIVDVWIALSMSKETVVSSINDNYVYKYVRLDKIHQTSKHKMLKLLTRICWSLYNKHMKDIQSKIKLHLRKHQDKRN
jgi:hypothetical protein